MKANELRIGNVILVDAPKGLLLPHVVVAQDIVDIALGKVNPSSIEPVKITPEILDKCGFKRLVKNWWMNPEGVYVDFDDDLKMLYYAPDGQWLGCGMTYFHQLQNLHFSITGKELEFRHD